MLRRLRLQQELTIDQLAHMAGLSGPYVSKLENNQMPAPPIETLARLARPLCVTVDSLVHGAEAVPPSVAQAFAESPEAFYLLADLGPRQRQRFVNEYAGRRRRRQDNPERLSPEEIEELKAKLMSY